MHTLMLGLDIRSSFLAFVLHHLIGGGIEDKSTFIRLVGITRRLESLICLLD